MPVKNIYSMTDHAIAKEVGRRLDQLRLERNLSQTSVADKSGISVKTYRSAVAGKGKFETIIGVLRVLGQLELVDDFVPEQSFSPIALLKMKGKQRKRASKPRLASADESDCTSTAGKPDGELGW